MNLYNSCYGMHKPLNRLLAAFAASTILKGTGAAAQCLETKLNYNAEVVSGLDCTVLLAMKILSVVFPRFIIFSILTYQTTYQYIYLLIRPQQMHIPFTCQR